MKFIRSTKCSLKFSTQKKKKELIAILEEYSKVVNFFINYFWEKNDITKRNLLKPIIDLPITYLSFAMRQCAAREAIDMIAVYKNRSNGTKIPIHKKNLMRVDKAIVQLLHSAKTKNFNVWLHLRCIGNKIIMDLPIKLHKHFNKYNEMGRRLNSYIITKDYVQFCFEIETNRKKEGKKCIGIDTGINVLATINNGNQYGLDIKDCIEKIKRCEQKSKGYIRAKRALKQRIDEVAKEIILKENPDLIVVEKLKNLGKNNKLKRRLSKNIRRSIGTWNWKYWLRRVEMQCELNRVSFRTVSPYNTSITCSSCGHSDRRNRNDEIFLCLNCGHEDKADINAGKNILNRFLTGPYGAGYKSINLMCN